MGEETLHLKWMIFSAVHGYASQHVTKEEYEDAKLVFFAGMMEMYSAFACQLDNPDPIRIDQWGKEISRFMEGAIDRANALAERRIRGPVNPGTPEPQSHGTTEA